jgi:hypothetical protein
MPQANSSAEQTFSAVTPLITKYFFSAQARQAVVMAL